MLVKTGSFASNTVTGNQSVVGVGFEPKVILFMSADLNADGIFSTAQPIFGVAVSDTQQWAVAALSIDNVGNADTYRHAHNDRCLHHGDGAGTNMQLDFVSHDADGFTVNVTDAPGTALIVPYLALGGDDLQVSAGVSSIATAGSPQTFTGASFEPDLVILGHIGRIAWPVTNGQHFIFGLSAFTGVGQAAFALSDQDTAATTVTNVYERSDSALLECFLNAEITRCTFNAMTSDGFSLNVPNLPDAAALTFGWLAIQGGRWKVGVETKPTSAIPKLTSGIGFQPEALMLFGGMNPSSTSVQESCNHTIGVTDGITQSYVAGGSNDGAGTSNSTRRLGLSEVIGRVDGGETQTAQAELTSLDADGFTLDWTIADAVAHEFIYLAMAGDEEPRASEMVSHLSVTTVA